MAIPPRHLLLIFCLLCLGCAVAATAADLPRYADWGSAQAAAQKSGKVVLVYVYQSLSHNVVLDAPKLTSAYDACKAMERKTFKDEDVVKALGDFEFLGLNADLPANAQFCEQYKVGTRYNNNPANAGDQDAFAAIPAYLFLDTSGKEYYRTYGGFAPDVFLQLLKQVSQVIAYQRAIAQNPNDARAEADLGRLYLVMERPNLAKPLLQAAVQADRDNARGARADAEMDLTILSIPDDPNLAFRNMVAYQFNYPDTKRTFELHYYMAVAQLAAGKYAQAEKILLDFMAIPPFLPDDQKTPDAKYGYLVQLKDKEVCFCNEDSLDAAKKMAAEVAKKNNEDAGKYTYARKATNPDYRNPWTEKADLLLQQWRKAQTEQKPK